MTVSLFAQFSPAVTELRSPAGAGSTEPELSTGPDGRIYMSWIEPVRPDGHSLRFASRAPGGAWSAPQTIASGANWFISYADFPSVAALPNGALVAHWLVNIGADYLESYHINLSISRDQGKTWSRPVIPYRDRSDSQHGLVTLTPTPEGRIGVIWLDGRNYSDAVDDVALVASSVGLDGRIVSETQLDPRACECCQTSAALTPDGLLVVYRDRSDKEVRDISIVEYQGGRWSSPRTVANDNWEIEACPINGPAISSQGRNVVVAWFTMAGGKQRVQAVFSSDLGKTFGRPIAIDDGNPIGRVDALMLPSGEALVSWVEVNNGAQIRIRRVGSDGSKAIPFVVAATSVAASSGFPRMERSGNEVVVAWTQTGEPPRVRTAVLKLQ